MDMLIISEVPDHIAYSWLTILLSSITWTLVDVLMSNWELLVNSPSHPPSAQRKASASRGQ